MSANTLGKDLMRHFQTGVSYMIPVVVAGGILTSVAVIGGGTGVWEETDTFWGVLRMIGQTGLNFIVPMISAYVAYSIADRPGLAPAFITGMIALNMGTGFLGGMITGVFTGYLVNALKKIPVPDRVRSLKSIMIIPICATFIVGVVLWYVLGTPIQMLTNALSDWLKNMSGANAAVMGAIIGAMMAFDMGGPVNKIANAFGTAAYAEGAYVASTAMLLAIAIPPTIMFLATLLDRKKVLYTDAERENGVTAIIMGIVGITEGTIPFALADPIRVIPSIMVGTAVSCAMNSAFGVTNSTMMATYFGIPFTTNIPLYLLSIAVGSLVGAFMVNALKTMKHKKQQAATADEK